MGGLRLREPAVDLAVALAVASSERGVAADAHIVAIGEIGLAGELRSVLRRHSVCAKPGAWVLRSAWCPPGAMARRRKTAPWAPRTCAPPGCRLVVSAPEVDAVVLGAGGSARMAGLDKMLAPLGDREVIVWSLRAFEAAPSIRRVVVTSSAENRAGVERAIDAAGLAKVVGVINGGPSRAHSVLNALDVLEDDGAHFAAIHDGARPFVTHELIERGVAAVRRHGLWWQRSRRRTRSSWWAPRAW